ncbi:MAG: NAD-dependent epimerase/dehydratase family protein [Simkaniaceae bacterium]|nr:NAD-dependent epimerase/dehydratase family protein [Simkaniaceae bacterium]
MKILITGGRGFLGKFLCQSLSDHELTIVHSKNCDLRQEKALLQFNSIKFDQIYHLAAWTEAGDFCLKHPGEQWIINQKINTHMLSWWQKYQPQAKMICMGTSCGYDPNYPLEESYYLQGTPIKSLFSYAMTKRMLLAGLIALNAQYGLEYLYIIPSTLYGSNYHLDGRQMHFIFDLIRKILKGALYGDPVILWGDGHQKRELVHVKDFIDICLKLNQTEKNIWINIGSGTEHSIRDFAKIICDYIEYPMEKIQFDTSKYVGARSKVLCINQLQKRLPNYLQTPIKEGLSQTIAWFLENEQFLLRKIL